MPKKIASLIVSLAAMSSVFLSSCSSECPVSSTDSITDFLARQGIAVFGEPQTKNITIPEEFGDVYENYNTLQKKQGFDLSKYRGSEAESYTYRVISVDGEKKENTEAHIIVCNSRIVGGDVASTELGGEMTGIIR